MRTKESWLKTEIQETLRTLKRLEDKMRIVAKTYEVDKLKLHIQEIEKIISLIVSLTYRKSYVSFRAKSGNRTTLTIRSK